MDSVKEIDERSNSFFDDQDEERILAEINKRYQQNRTGGTSHVHNNNQSGVTSNPMGNLAMNTEQFMKEMGVLNSDVLTTNQMDKLQTKTQAHFE